MTTTWTPEASIDAVRRAALRGITMAGNEVRNEMLRLIQQTAKSGREYRRRGVTHTASAPGESPASDTGTLVREITLRIDAPTVTATINSGAAHSASLEFGTIKMEPRPYARLALSNKRNEIEGIVGREMRQALSVSFGR